MKVRRKSLHRSANAKRVKHRANQRAAKERKRLERAMRDEPVPDASHVVIPKRRKPLFVVTVRCRDGESVRMALYETPFGLTVSPTDVGRRVACILKNYRPA